jgi:hypothetical protein
MRTTLLLVVLIIETAIVGTCQQNELSQGFITKNPRATEAIDRDINHDSYSIFSLNQAQDLLRNTVCSNACDPEAKDFYAIIHVLKWSTAQSNSKQTVAGEHWYVYHPEKHGWTQDQFTDGKRLFNAKQFYLLYVHLNIAEPISHTPVYEVQITKKLPQNVANLFALFQLETKGAAERQTYAAAWGGRIINVGQRPSDIKVDPGSLPDASHPLSSSTEVTSAQTFNNEGKYWWDVSVGVPERKLAS